MKRGGAGSTTFLIFGFGKAVGRLRPGDSWMQTSNPKRKCWVRALGFQFSQTKRPKGVGYVAAMASSWAVQGALAYPGIHWPCYNTLHSLSLPQRLMPSPMCLLAAYSLSFEEVAFLSRSWTSLALAGAPCPVTFKGSTKSCGWRREDT